ncbi:alpha-ketoglutarate-dependent dioxygenase AlkB [Sphingomonas sp. PP-CC-3G-468]|uniref:alpha-ketoglutarate-dependent dioxygenase AlkB n=1 Tax=Sphingomonas sp. PP-CC-3G-468 TaxID=2135656 RepID=UPI0014043D21|nr:alpha-ketoglutarate-dependent dioxygenase AlkB [Sphingomonas sp. PP-CC-3G-468]
MDSMKMQDAIPGVYVIPNFLDRFGEGYDQKLIEELLNMPASKRGDITQHFFGNTYAGIVKNRFMRGGINDINKEVNYRNEFPPELKRMVDWFNTECLEIDQANVNLYVPGQGLGLHRDEPKVAKKFEPWVFTVSLGSHAEMCLVSDGGPRELVSLPAKSALLLTREALYCWRHGISEAGDEKAERPGIPLDAPLLAGSPFCRISINLRCTRNWVSGEPAPSEQGRQMSPVEFKRAWIAIGESAELIDQALPGLTQFSVFRAVA